MPGGKRMVCFWERENRSESDIGMKGVLYKGGSDQIYLRKRQNIILYFSRIMRDDLSFRIYSIFLRVGCFP